MKTFFHDKFEYNHHCNEKVFTLINQNPATYSQKIATLISHTLNAHTIWNSRILEVTASVGVWDTYLPSELAAINQNNFETSQQIISQLEGGLTIGYTNTKGEKHNNTVEDILFHVVNHSTYHRGQIITALKQEGVLPAVTDYIFFKKS